MEVVVRVVSGKWSSLSDDEVDGLARLMMPVICEEWDSSSPRLHSSVIYERLVEDGEEIPDWAMADALDRLNGWFITPYISRRPSHVESEAAEFRKHGDMTVGDVNGDFCG